MKYLALNGSPRARTSNSTRILGWLASAESSIQMSEIQYLAHVKKHEEILAAARDARGLIFCFPLYVDSMPAQQKRFFELMEREKETFRSMPVAFIIHSGFPESLQSESLAEYLEHFAGDIMGMKLLGVAIIAGSEALQMAPDEMFTRQKGILQEMMRYIEAERRFPDDINERLNGARSLSRTRRILFSINPFKHFYWHLRASKHQHRVHLKAQPYR
jgi:multimeric flavodoxin WrbA